MGVCLWWLHRGKGGGPAASQSDSSQSVSQSVSHLSVSQSSARCHSVLSQPAIRQSPNLKERAHVDGGVHEQQRRGRAHGPRAVAAAAREDLAPGGLHRLQALATRGGGEGGIESTRRGGGEALVSRDGAGTKANRFNSQLRNGRSESVTRQASRYLPRRPSPVPTPSIQDGVPRQSHVRQVGSLVGPPQYIRPRQSHVRLTLYSRGKRTFSRALA